MSLNLSVDSFRKQTLYFLTLLNFVLIFNLQAQSPLGGGSGSALASTLDGKIWSINLDNALAIEITQSPFFNDGINSLALNAADNLIYYVSEKGTNRNLYAYDYMLDTHVVVTGLNVFTTNTIGIGQGSAHYYNGHLYLGVENVIPASTGTADVIYKISFVSGSGGKRVASTTPVIYRSYLDEWGDFVIDNGIVYNNLANKFETFGLNGSTTSTISKTYFGQLAQSFSGAIYNIDDFIQEIEKDATSLDFGKLKGIKKTITTDCSNAWNVPVSGFDPGKDAIDATGPAPSKNAIGDLIWFDSNANGIKDSNDPGIANVDVELWWDVDNDNIITSSKDQFVSSAKTSIDGTYKFNDVQAGNYLVKVVNISSIVINASLISGTDPKPIKANKLCKYFEDGDFGYTGRYNPILPVEYSFITASQFECKGILAWKTESEDNAKYFEIMKSNDNVNFVSVAYIPAKGTIYSGAKYDYVDNSPSPKTYYKLKQVDTDGSFSYSETVSFINDCNGKSTVINLYPNPTVSYLSVNFNSISEKNCEVFITDIALKVIKSIPFKANKGVNQLEINVEDLSIGEYYIKIIDNSNLNLMEKFIKLDK